MRDEIINFVKNITASTMLDEIQALCQTDEELHYVLERLDKITISQKRAILPLSIRIKAKHIFQNTPTKEIETIEIQKKLKISYHEALAVKDWLIRRRTK